MSKLLRAFIGVCLCLLGIAFAQAQTLPGSPVYQTWYPQANSPSVTISTASTAHLYPGNGPTARICNTGIVDAYINPFGTSNSVTATTNSFWLQASACIAYNIKPSTTQFTYFAAITASGSTTFYLETGLGALGFNSGMPNVPTGLARGDLYGSYPNPQVAAFSALSRRVITYASHTLATAADAIVDCDTSAGNVIWQVPVTLGSASHQKRIRVNKTSTDANSCCLSADGSTCLAYIINYQDSGGAGWLDVTANGSTLAFQGIP